MKKFTNISDFLASKPSKETIEKVLKLVNSSVITQIRKEVYLKEAEQRKLDKMVKTFTELKLVVPTSLNERKKVLAKEIETLKKELPPKVIKPKKEEVK